MQKIYINTETGKFYGADGAQFRDKSPNLAYKRSEKLIFQLCTDSPDANAPNSNPDQWTKATFEQLGVSALITVDNDFLRWHKGTLAEDFNPDEVSTIKVNIPNLSSGTFAASGIIRLYDENGEITPLEYTKVIYSTGSAVFSLALGTELSTVYPAGAQVDVPDGMYIQAPMNKTESDPATGLFVFDVVAYSPKLKAALEYSNRSEAPNVAGMEILIFQTTADSVIELDSFICSTVSIHSTMADANPNAEFPETAKDEQIALIYSQLRLLYADNPLEFEFSVDGSTDWHKAQTENDKFYRQRLSNIDAEWSGEIAIVAGIPSGGGTGTGGVSASQAIAYSLIFG